MHQEGVTQVRCEASNLSSSTTTYNNSSWVPVVPSTSLLVELATDGHKGHRPDCCFTLLHVRVCPQYQQATARTQVPRLNRQALNSCLARSRLAHESASSTYVCQPAVS